MKKREGIIILLLILSSLLIIIPYSFFKYKDFKSENNNLNEGLYNLKSSAYISSYPTFKPYCDKIGTKSEGWYYNGRLIYYFKCGRCKAECKNIYADKSGWYNSCNGKLILLGKCSYCKGFDSGKDYYKKGYVDYNNKNYTDTCIERNELIEYYCSGDNLNISMINCSYACYDGACFNESFSFRQSEVVFEIVHNKSLPVYCNYDTTRNKLAIIIKENGIYDNEILNKTFLKYFYSVKTDIGIDNVGIRKFSGSTKEEFDQLIEELVLFEFVGYVVIVGMDLPIVIERNDTYRCTYNPINNRTECSGTKMMKVDSSYHNEVLSYVNRVGSYDTCKDLAISYIFAPEVYNDSQKIDYINQTFFNFINYHNNPYEFKGFRNITLVIQDPEFDISYIPKFYYNQINLSNQDYLEIQQNLNESTFILSYHIHGSPALIELGLNGNRTATVIEGVLGFYYNAGPLNLYVDVIASCNHEAIDSYYVNRFGDISRIGGSGFCCWPQTWLKTGAWAFIQVNDRNQGGNEENPDGFSFEIFCYEEKILGKALRKTYHTQSDIFGDILGTFP